MTTVKVKKARPTEYDLVDMEVPFYREDDDWHENLHVRTVVKYEANRSVWVVCRRWSGDSDVEYELRVSYGQVTSDSGAGMFESTAEIWKNAMEDCQDALTELMPVVDSANGDQHA